MSTDTSTINTSSSTANGTNRRATAVSTLRGDLQALKSDLDTLLAHASELTDAELSEAQERILLKFGSVRQTAKGMAVQASKQFNHGVEVTTEYVKEKPMQSVALAAGVGALLGIIFSRR